MVWESDFQEDNGESVDQIRGAARYRPGGTYRESWNRGVRGPAFSGSRCRSYGRAGYASLRATVTDGAGGTTTQTIIRAYRMA